MADIDQISQRLEQAFSEHGFAEPNVAKLKDASGVSLRTLYRYFPSKEDMVVGALNFRHQRYIRLLEEELSSPGDEAILTTFCKLESWMRESAPNGCMSTHAMSAYPENQVIRKAVTRHKLEVQTLGALSGRSELAQELFLLHEGASTAWPFIGEKATQAARQTLTKLLNGDK